MRTKSEVFGKLIDEVLSLKEPHLRSEVYQDVTLEILLDIRDELVKLNSHKGRTKTITTTEVPFSENEHRLLDQFTQKNIET